MVGERGKIALELAEMLIQRLQMSGYELQRSLPLVTASGAVGHIEEAVEHLNEAIKAIQLAAAPFEGPSG